MTTQPSNHTETPQCLQNASGSSVRAEPAENKGVPVSANSVPPAATQALTDLTTELAALDRHLARLRGRVDVELKLTDERMGRTIEKAAWMAEAKHRTALYALRNRIDGRMGF